ncbi:hypothetical protein NDU88_005475 [Pleurodeles waltl]|uniref:Uncharacterized protein n=1 Tax=Pleurodeles waltl TaxID=8319 RepID=A0AAV7PJP1_PLEWA|nr:hypothetical protein NDU88_005475 [Pleurodeles waltl]
MHIRVGICDGLAETRPHTLPTSAVAASGVPEQQGLSAKESGSSWTTREGGILKRSAEKESERKEWKKESGESVEDGEEEWDDRASSQEATETGTPIGVSLRPAESDPGGARRRPECHGDREAERSSLPRFWRSVAISGV